MKKLAVLVLVSLFFFTGCSGDKPVTTPPAAAAPVEQPQPAPEPQKEERKNPELPGALLVMVDNYYKARPQSGLDKADLVYEIMAEAGITRYMALFYSEAVPKIGPVRSARYYFAYMARGYNSPLAHAGGSQEALEIIQKIGIKDLDEIYNAGGYFWRDKGRKMPHNLYTSTELLLKGVQAKKYELVVPPDLTEGEEFGGIPQGKKLTLNYSVGTYDYVVDWKYNGEKYERDINGKPHVMEDGTVIKADNVVIMEADSKDVIKNKILLSEIKLLGSGKAWFFSAGKMNKGTWEKASPQSRMIFKNENGKLIGFTTGKTWVQVVPSFGRVTVSD